MNEKENDVYKICNNAGKYSGWIKSHNIYISAVLRYRREYSETLCGGKAVFHALVSQKLIREYDNIGVYKQVLEDNGFLSYPIHMSVISFRASYFIILSSSHAEQGAAISSSEACLPSLPLASTQGACTQSLSRSLARSR